MHDRDVMQAYYTRVDRHFDPQTESYTGTDSLITALRRGWQMVGTARREDVLLGRGVRRTSLYHISLRRDDETMTMPIVSNPYLLRVLVDYELSVRHVGDEAIAAELAQLLA